LNKKPDVIMRQAKEGDRVKIHYTGRLEDGTVFNSSEGRPPLGFVIGDGLIMPGIEKGVIGMVIDCEITVEIPSEKAFGCRREGLVAELDRKIIPENLDPEIRQQLELRQPDG
jgi:peptidylprolyl isomerase